MPASKYPALITNLEGNEAGPLFFLLTFLSPRASPGEEEERQPAAHLSLQVDRSVCGCEFECVYVSVCGCECTPVLCFWTWVVVVK